MTSPRVGPMSDREPALTRTELIVARVRQELEERSGKGLVPPVVEPSTLALGTAATRAGTIRETLAMVQTYAESLNHQATQVSVSRMIIMITAAALGRLGIPYALLNELDSFAADINALVYSPSGARQ